jgi:hypothetical protein
MQKTPPRYVPTLTQVVPLGSDAPAAGPHAAPVAAMPEPSSFAADVSQKMRLQLLARTKQYIDAELQKRLRETVAQLALEHSHKLFEELQPQIEATIAQVVDEAVAQAVARAATSRP